MGRKKKLWSMRVGARGSSVQVYERTAGGPLWIRWWVPETPTAAGHYDYRALGHTNREVAEQTAREVSGQLIASTLAEARGGTTLGDVLGAYQADVADHQKGSGPREAKRRALMWTVFLGATRDVTTLDFPTLDRFVRERRAGMIVLPKESEYALRKKVTDRAIGADLEFLRAALNHATRVVRPSGKKLLSSNPVAGYPIPRNKNPKRPVATYDRYLAVHAKADEVDPQKLFAGFLTLIESLGWRVSAVCALRWKDIDLTATKGTPNGRIYKTAEADKEGVAMWLPMGKATRAAIDRIRAQNPGVGDYPIFPAPRARIVVESPAQPRHAGSDVIALPVTVEPSESVNEIPKAWTRHHARKLLERAENAAGLSHQEGGDFHPYRRAWATARKHLPDADVMAAGGWSDSRALKMSYQQVDEATLLSVVEDATKLRDAGAMKAEGA